MLVCLDKDSSLMHAVIAHYQKSRKNGKLWLLILVTQVNHNLYLFFIINDNHSLVLRNTSRANFRIWDAQVWSDVFFRASWRQRKQWGPRLAEPIAFGGKILFHTLGSNKETSPRCNSSGHAHAHTMSTMFMKQTTYQDGQTTNQYTQHAIYESTNPSDENIFQELISWIRFSCCLILLADLSSHLVNIHYNCY